MRGAVLLLALAVPTAAAAQQPRPQPRSCLVHVDSAGYSHILQPPGQPQQVFAWGGVYGRCLNDPTTMRSDSLAWFAGTGELYLVGNVRFRDSVAVLDADRVTYWVRQERLYAVGNVYTRNLASGSELRGPNLDYYRAKPPLRDTLELRASQRPTIHFRPTPARGAAVADSAEPFVVVGDRVRMRGSQRMWGGGRVTIDRTDLHAQGDSAQLDLADSLGWLVGSPLVVGRDTARSDSAAYRLTGQRIRFDLTGAQDVRRVRSNGEADARGPDWILTGDTIVVDVDTGRIQRAQTWGRERRGTARAELSVITADSLDIQMPGQEMRLVWAYGRSRATSRPDSTAPEDDWLAGDTLRANFEPRTDSTGRQRTEIDRIAAFGTARALYHTENERDRTGPRGVNYSRGDRIAIAMNARRVRTVDIVGRVDGVYLEPVPLDSAAADSLPGDTTRLRTTPAATAAPTPRRPPR